MPVGESDSIVDPDAAAVGGGRGPSSSACTIQAGDGGFPWHHPYSFDGRATLIANLVLYGALMLLSLVLASCWRARPHRSCSRMLHSTLLLGFAVGRVGWAAFLVDAAFNRKARGQADQRAVFVADRLLSLWFLALAGLLLTEVGDAIVIGWKSSQRLWVGC